MIADCATQKLRATSFGAFYFVTGIGALLASLGAGWLWDHQGPSGDFPDERGDCWSGRRNAEPACRGAAP